MEPPGWRRHDRLSHSRRLILGVRPHLLFSPAARCISLFLCCSIRYPVLAIAMMFFGVKACTSLPGDTHTMDLHHAWGSYFGASSSSCVRDRKVLFSLIGGCIWADDLALLAGNKKAFLGSHKALSTIESKQTHNEHHRDGGWMTEK